MLHSKTITKYIVVAIRQVIKTQLFSRYIILIFYKKKFEEKKSLA